MGQHFPVCPLKVTCQCLVAMCEPCARHSSQSFWMMKIFKKVARYHIPYFSAITEWFAIGLLKRNMGCVYCSSEHTVHQTACWFDTWCFMYYPGYHNSCQAVTAWCVSHFRFLVGKRDRSSRSSHRMACHKDSDRHLLSVSSQCTCRPHPTHHPLLHQTCISQQSRSFVFRCLFIIVLLCCCTFHC